MTKKQLITQLTSLTQDYLGFGIEGLYGVNSLSKSELQTRVGQMKRAVAWKRYADKLKSSLEAQYGKQALLAFAISGKSNTEYEKYSRACRMASNYHHHYTTERAYSSL